MAKTLGEFLHDLIKKSGQNADDENIKNFLLNGELVKIEMPEDIANGINRSLISIKEAKNNHPEIKPHYTQLSLLSIDKTIEKLLDELGIDDEARAEILSETSTYKRVPALVQRVRDLESKKASSGKEDKAAIQKQIDDLHAAIRNEKQRADAAEQKFKDELKNFKINNKKSALFGSYKTVYDDLDPEIKMTTLLNILEKRLNDTGAIITFDDNENLVLLRKDGTNYFGDNNTQINPQQYVEKLLSETKLIKTAQATPQATPAATPTGQQPTSANGDTKTGNPTLKELIKGSMKDLENSQAVPIMGS